MDAVKRIEIGIFLMIMLILIHSTIYIYLEHLNIIDALYFSITTITTVGYGDISPKTPIEKIITSIYMLISIGIGFYVLGNISELFISGYFKKASKRKIMENRIKNLKNHYIVCGYGKIGKVAADKLRKEGAKFVVIDTNAEMLENELESDPLFNYVVGDATDDEVLIKAKIKDAKCLISAVSRDSDNVYIVLSSKRLNPNLYVIAKADEQVAMDKLLIAGADKVVSPYIIGGLRMAELALKPDILDFVSAFMSIAKYEYNEDLEIRKIVVEEGSELCGKAISETQIRQKSGATIIGVKKGEELITNPSPNLILEPGDVVYAFGTSEQLNSLEKLAVGSTNNKKGFKLFK